MKSARKTLLENTYIQTHHFQKKFVMGRQHCEEVTLLRYLKKKVFWLYMACTMNSLKSIFFTLIWDNWGIYWSIDIKLIFSGHKCIPFLKSWLYANLAIFQHFSRQKGLVWNRKTLIKISVIWRVLYLGMTEAPKKKLVTNPYFHTQFVFSNKAKIS